MSLDEEYYSLILAQLVKIPFLKIMEKNSLKNEIKLKIAILLSIKLIILLRYQNLLFRSFQDLCNSSNKIEFSEKIQEWCKILFSVSTAKFLFFENNQLVEYSNNKTKNNEILGVAGSVISSNRPMIISEIRKNHLFDPSVDLSSLLPILYYPLTFKKFFNFY